ncbi:Hypothetical_protein [Hexamita inflata]|uniref:Hypothetical_protein n=1 Tax=Hexamita inflata TaxID=28002 RepID=A0AA86R4M1_9EUKA|nr:Hypothetical protein HINF_LOCUS59254 [Hexamita inflata]
MFTLTSFKCTNQYISQQICSNINIGSYKSSVGYCLKESYLSSLVQSGSIAHSHGKHVHYTLFTTKVQDLQMNITYQMADLPSFALFGLTQSIQLQNSNFSVFIPQQLAQGAIVCLQCDVNVSTSDFLFSASGQNISGLVLIPFKILILNNLFTQFRLNGINVGGVLLNGSGIDYSLDECNISGYIVSQKVSGSKQLRLLELLQFTQLMQGFAQTLEDLGKDLQIWLEQQTSVICAEVVFTLTDYVRRHSTTVTIITRNWFVWTLFTLMEKNARVQKDILQTIVHALKYWILLIT